MLIVDDLLLSPGRGLFWIFREMHKCVQQEMADSAQQITDELSELYMLLETGRIDEEEFDTREKELLDRLDMMQTQDQIQATDN